MSRPNIAFPRVWKKRRDQHLFREETKNAGVCIVYRNRVEYYHEGSERYIYRADPGEKFDPYAEEEMLRGNAWKRVH